MHAGVPFSGVTSRSFRRVFIPSVHPKASSPHWRVSIVHAMLAGMPRGSNCGGRPLQDEDWDSHREQGYLLGMEARESLFCLSGGVSLPSC